MDTGTRPSLYCMIGCGCWECGRMETMSKYFSLVLVITNAVCIVVNIINQKWDVMVLNIITCVLCLGNFMVSD